MNHQIQFLCGAGVQNFAYKFAYIWKEGDEGRTVEAGKSIGATLSTRILLSREDNSVRRV